MARHNWLSSKKTPCWKKRETWVKWVKNQRRQNMVRVSCAVRVAATINGPKIQKTETKKNGHSIQKKIQIQLFHSYKISVARLDLFLVGGVNGPQERYVGCAKFSQGASGTKMEWERARTIISINEWTVPRTHGWARGTVGTGRRGKCSRTAPVDSTWLKLGNLLSFVRNFLREDDQNQPGSEAFATILSSR